MDWNKRKSPYPGRSSSRNFAADSRLPDISDSNDRINLSSFYLTSKSRCDDRLQARSPNGGLHYKAPPPRKEYGQKYGHNINNAIFPNINGTKIRKKASFIDILENDDTDDIKLPTLGTRSGTRSTSKQRPAGGKSKRKSGFSPLPKTSEYERHHEYLSQEPPSITGVQIPRPHGFLPSLEGYTTSVFLSDKKSRRRKTKTKRPS